MTVGLPDIFDAFLSPDYNAHNEANKFLVEQIRDNSEFFQYLFQIYNTSQNIEHKKLCLIFLKYQIKLNYNTMTANFNTFLQLFNYSLNNTEDFCMLKLLSEICFQITIRFQTVWPELPSYLTKYSTNPNFLTFSIYLFESILEKNVRKLYKEVIETFSPELLLLSLQSPNFEMKIEGTKIVTRLSQIVRPIEFFTEKFGTHLDILFRMAQESSILPPKIFSDFWSSMLFLSDEFSERFCAVCKTFLGDGYNFPADCRMFLFDFILFHHIFLVPEELPGFISLYFSLQVELENFDSATQIFVKFSDSFFRESYPIFRENIDGMLRMDDGHIREVGLSLLTHFLLTFNLHPSDVSLFLNEAIQLYSEYFCQHILKVIYYSIQCQTIEASDKKLIANFLLFLLKLENIPLDIQIDILNYFTMLAPSSYMFDCLINSYQFIQPLALAKYFATLISTFEVSNTLTTSKASEFIQNVIGVFNSADAAIKKGKDAAKDKESIQQLHYYFVLRGSAANFLMYFSYFIPSVLGEFLPIGIQTYIDMLINESLFDDVDEDAIYTIDDIKTLFAAINKYMKKISLQLLRENYKQLTADDDMNDLIFLFISEYGIECPHAKTLVAQFFNLFNSLQKRFNIIDLISSFDFITSISKFLYKIPKADFIQKYLIFLIAAFGKSEMSGDIFNDVSHCLVTISKPKRIRYYGEQNNYLEIIRKAAVRLKSFVKSFKESTKNFLQRRCFTGYVDFVLFLIYIGDADGHLFLEPFIFSFYQEYPEIAENELFSFFIKALKTDYFNGDEMSRICAIVNAVLQNGTIYHRNWATVYQLAILLIKRNPDSVNTQSLFFNAFQSIIESRPENHPNDDQENIRYSASILILTCFNMNILKLETVMTFLPEILSVFPVNDKIKELSLVFWIEIRTFIMNNSQLMVGEVLKGILHSLLKYLSFQNNAHFIFNIPEEANSQILDTFRQLLDCFCRQNQTDPPNVLANFLPDQQASIEFILTLL